MSSKSASRGFGQGVCFIICTAILEVIILQAKANPLTSLTANGVLESKLTITSPKPSSVPHSAANAVIATSPLTSSELQVSTTPLPIEASRSLSDPMIEVATSLPPVDADNLVILEPSQSNHFEPRSSSPSPDGLGHLLMAQLAQSMLSDFDFREDFSDLPASPTLLTPLIAVTPSVIVAPPATPSPPPPSRISATTVAMDDHFPTAILSSFLASAVPDVAPSQLLPSSVDHWNGDGGIDSLLDNLINPSRPPLPSLVTTFRPSSVRIRPSSSSSIQFSSNVDNGLHFRSSAVAQFQSISPGGAFANDNIDASSFFEAFLSTAREPPSHEVAPSSSAILWRPTSIQGLISVQPSSRPLVAESRISIQHPESLEVRSSSSFIATPSTNFFTFKTGSPVVELLLPSIATVSKQAIDVSTVSAHAHLASTASTHATTTTAHEQITNDDMSIKQEEVEGLQIQDLAMVRPNQPDATVDKIIAGLMNIIRPLKGTPAATTESIPQSHVPLTGQSDFFSETTPQHHFAVPGNSLSSVLESLNSQYLMTEQDHRVTTPALLVPATASPTPTVIRQSVTPWTVSAAQDSSTSFQATLSSSAAQEMFPLQEKNEPVPALTRPRPPPISQAVLKRKPTTKRPPTTFNFAIPTRLRTTTGAPFRRTPPTKSTTTTTTTTEKIISESVHGWGEVRPVTLDLNDNNPSVVDSRLPIIPPSGVVSSQEATVGSTVLHIKEGTTLGSSSAASRPLLVNRPLLMLASSDRPSTTSSHVRLPVGSHSVLLIAPSTSSHRPVLHHNTPLLEFQVPELLEQPLSSSAATIISSQATVLLKPTPVASSHPVRQTILNTVVTISDSSSSSDDNEEFAHFDNGHSSSNQLMSSSFDLTEPFEPAAIVDPPAAQAPPLPPRLTTRRTTTTTSTEPTTTTTTEPSTTTTTATTTTTTSTTTTTTTEKPSTRRTRRPFFSRRSTTTKRPPRSTTSRRPLLRSTTTRPPRSTTARRNAFWPFRTATSTSTRKPSIFLKRPSADSNSAVTTAKPVAVPPVRPGQTMMSYGMSLLPAAVIATIIGLPLVLAGKKKRDVSGDGEELQGGEHWRRLMREIEQLQQPQYN